MLVSELINCYDGDSEAGVRVICKNRTDYRLLKLQCQKHDVNSIELDGDNEAIQWNWSDVWRYDDLDSLGFEVEVFNIRPAKYDNDKRIRAEVLWIFLEEKVND